MDIGGRETGTNSLSLRSSTYEFWVRRLEKRGYSTRQRALKEWLMEMPNDALQPTSGRDAAFIG